MLRKILLASAGTIAMASSALAADLPSRAPPPVYVPPTPIFTWTGIYVGGQIGYAWGTQDTNLFVPGTLDGRAPSTVVLDNYSAEGVIGGAHVGYNYQANQWVIGLEGTVDGTSISKTFVPGTVFPALAYGPGFGVTLSTNSSVQGSIRGRLGVAWDRLLVYATGGAAFAGFSGTVSTPFASVTESTTRVGWTVGGGVEYAVTNNWSVRAEYRYSDFGSFSNSPAAGFTPLNGLVLAGGPTLSRKFTENQVQVGFSYKFDTYAPAPIVAKY